MLLEHGEPILPRAIASRPISPIGATDDAPRSLSTLPVPLRRHPATPTRPRCRGLVWRVLLLLAAQQALSGPPYGLERREPIGPYLDQKLPPTPPPSSGGWEAVPAFPHLSFQDPVFLTHAPGSRRLYVCGRQGIIESFENDPHTAIKTVFLDLRARCQGWDDSGLLGLAFHPEFGRDGAPNRGYFYVAYNYTDRPTPGPDRPPIDTLTYNRLSRFTVPDGAEMPTRTRNWS